MTRGKRVVLAFVIAGVGGLALSYVHPDWLAVVLTASWGAASPFIAFIGWEDK